MNNPNQEKVPTLILESKIKTDQILTEISKVIVGQEHMVRCLLMALICDGHALLEGLPGLAKTLAVKTLASILHAKFQRIQFTPDLLPSDLIGTLIYRQEKGDFVVKKGPLFANLVLADEINRAPAKVQSALLEAMAEKQVTIGETSYPMDEPFLVLATQNPIEQEGTYALPEAQLDRFLFKLVVDYPTRAEEKQILERMSAGVPEVKKIFAPTDVLEFRKALQSVYVDESIREYILRLVAVTRKKDDLNENEIKATALAEIREYIHIGASPRATLFINKAAMAYALLDGRHYVIPEDVKAIAKEVLRHRLILGFEAESQGIQADDLINKILSSVTVP